MVFLKHESETEDAQYCQPSSHSPGSPVVVGSGGRLPSRRSDPPPKAFLVKPRARLGQFCQTPCLGLLSHGSPNHVRDVKISLADHRQRIGPRPVRGRRAPTCGSQSQTTPRWQRGDLPRKFPFPFLARHLLEQGASNGWPEDLRFAPSRNLAEENSGVPMGSRGL